MSLLIHNGMTLALAIATVRHIAAHMLDEFEFGLRTKHITT